MEEAAPGPAPQIAPESFAARRQRVADSMGDGVRLVVATHTETTHSNDVHHLFRPHSDLWYLTGCKEPGAALVLEGGTGRSDLFVRPRQPDAEIWTGRRLGVDRAAEVLGVDRAHALDELGAFLREDVETLAIVDHDPAAAEVVANAVGPYEDGHDIVARHRLIKDDEEIAMLRRAAQVSMAAHEDAYAYVRAGGHEFEADAALSAGFRRAGSTGPGYPSIVGAGANAAILHYVENMAPIRAGDMVLIDAGCEWGYYNADITRTIPADGAFTPFQARLYDLVQVAQEAAMKEVRPGNPMRAPHDAAVEVLTAGLADLGWLPPEGDNRHRPFYMHGTSHFLGLDVHDVGSYKGEDGESRLLEPGMVLTVEPGLYANPDFATLPPGVSPFGIRIENDLVVTEDGHEDLNAALPTRREAVESLCTNG